MRFKTSKKQDSEKRVVDDLFILFIYLSDNSNLSSLPESG